MTPHPKESLLEKVVSEPAILLEEGIGHLKVLEENALSKKPFKVAEEYWNTLGPGLVTGAAGDDPAGIATYSQAGARYGFQLLWISWATFPLTAVVQEMCARIGMATGHGLAANIRRHYPAWVLYVLAALLFLANSFNIGANLGAMAEAVRLLSPQLSAPVLVICFGFISLGLQIFTTYARFARYLKYLAFFLLAYIASALMSGLDWQAVGHGFAIPTITWTREQVFLICAILGTTISPYMFFWQTSQEVEERNLRIPPPSRENWHRAVSREEIGRMRKDVWSGMFFSNLVMFFIIAACAGTLFLNGGTDIRTAADAAAALLPFAGPAAYLLFAAGIIGIGLLSIPVLAGSASYAISESFGWKQGLYRQLEQAHAFYGIIILSVLVGIGLNFVGIDPIKALIYSAIANAFVAPFALFFIVRLAGRKDVLKGHVSGALTSAIGWIAFGVMALASAATVVSVFL